MSSPSVKHVTTCRRARNRACRASSSPGDSAIPHLPSRQHLICSRPFVAQTVLESWASPLSFRAGPSLTISSLASSWVTAASFKACSASRRWPAACVRRRQLW